MESIFNSDRFFAAIRKTAFAALIGLFCTLAASGQNQVRITTNVLPPYSPYIQDYPGTGNRVQIFISNLSGKSLNVRLLGKLEGDNGVVIQTSPQYRPRVPLELRPTDVNRLLTRAELEGLFDLNQIQVQGMDKNLLYRGLPLPEGNYQLCVQAFDNATTRSLSADFPMGCSGLIPVRVIEPPILTFPIADAQIPAKMPQTQIFTWTAPTGILPTQVNYTIRIVELPNNQVEPNVYIDAVDLPKSGIEVKNLLTTTFLYGPQHPPLQPGKRYAWRVQAVATRNQLNILNQGKSPVQAFTYGATMPALATGQMPFAMIPGLPDSSDSKVALKSYKMPANCSCKAAVNLDGKVDNSVALKTRKVTIAGFQMELLANVKETDGMLSGTGMIPVPMVNSSYVKLRVNLFDIQTNENGQVIGGFARAIYKKGAPGYTPDYDKPQMPALEMTPATMENISEFMGNAKDQLVSSLSNSAKSVGFELPLGIDKSFGPVNTVIAITNMTFLPDQAFFDANTWVKTANAMVSGIPLSGYNMCFSPQKPCGEGILYLADKMQLSPYLALKGAEGAPSSGPFAGPDTNVVTHVVFDEKGFKQMRVHGLLTPPGLVDAQTKGKVEISVNAGLVNFQNWTALLSFPKFYVEGLPDFKFSMQPGKPALYDHSETVTPATLPEGYLNAAEVNLWQGLYFPEIDIELPSFIKNAEGKTLTTGIKNMISDNNGFSGKAFIENILSVGEGSLAGWFYSIDQLSVNFLKSNFQTSQMTGRLVLPVFKDSADAAARIPYSCTLSKNEQGGQFSMAFAAIPPDVMKVDIWKAELALQNSEIIATYSGSEGVEAHAKLNGSMTINAGIMTVPLASFKDLVLSTNAPYFSMAKFALGQASPQKLMGGSPLTLEEAEFVKDASDPLRFGFKFAGGLDLTGEHLAAFTAKAAATVYFKVGLKNGNRPDWAFDKVHVDSLSLDTKLGPLAIAGNLGFYENVEKYGNGFAGNLKMDVTGFFGVKVAARFGKTLPEEGGYKYWYVGGKVNLGPTGIPLTPLPLSLRSFGGGLYSNVTKIFGTDGQISYVPGGDGTMGFEAMVGVGLTMDNVFTTEGTMTLELSNGKLGKVAFDTRAWLLGASEEKAFARGTGSLVFDNELGVLDVNVTLGAKYGVSGANLEVKAEQARLLIDSKTGKWFMSMGVPGQRSTIALHAAGLLDLNFKSYFMLGNQMPAGVTLPAVPNVSESVLKEIGYKGNQIETFKEGSPYIAFGAGLSMDADFGVGPFHLRYDGQVGFDMALAKQDQPCFATNAVPGLDGWYATGQIYAYMHFALDLDIDTWVYEGTFTVVELEAAALLRGGMVNPVWLNGHVLLRYRALGGLVKGRVNLEFWYNKGQRCEPVFSPPNPFAGQPLIASLGPSGTDKEVSILSPYYAEFNYPVNTDLIIDIEVPQGQQIEAGTQGTTSQSPNGGTILHREFQLQYLNGFTTQATKLDPKYADCGQTNTGRYNYGRNEEGDPNYNVSFYRHAALVPNSTYDISLDLQVRIWVGDSLTPYIFKGQTVEQKETVSFRTGPCISVLSKGSGDNDPILTSYPYEGQRFFMKGEQSETFIRFKTDMSCCMTNLNSDENYDLKVRFTPLEGTSFADDNSGAVLTASANFVGTGVDYVRPAGMKNKTLYRFELVRIPKPDYVKKQFAAAQKAKENVKKITYANIYKSASGYSVQQVNDQLKKANPGIAGSGLPASNSVNEKYINYYSEYTAISEQDYEAKAAEYGTTYKINAGTVKTYSVGKATVANPSLVQSNPNAVEQAKFAKALEVKMYRYYFKTSAFNTLPEKVKAIDFPETSSDAFAEVFDALTTKMVSTEAFDTFELQPEKLTEETYRPPMVLLLADASSSWFKNIAAPVARLMHSLPESFYAEVDRIKEFKSEVGIRSHFLRSLAKFNTMYDGIQKPFTNQEIMQIVPSEKKKYK